MSLLADFVFKIILWEIILGVGLNLKGITMKEPGLDGRHRNQTPPKRGEIQQKRSDTLNENLSKPIVGFSPKATLGFIRKETGETSEAAIRKAAQKR